MKIAYVVTEHGCMDPTTGANQHIRMGMEQLSKRAQAIDFTPNAPLKNGTRLGQNDSQALFNTNAPSLFRRTGAWGALRDLRDFWRKLQQARRISRAVADAECDAAYVRMEALSPISLLLRRRNISVFIEANGLQFESRKNRFRSWLSWLYRPLERYIYERADHVFFVGSYGQYWKSNCENWTEVENGVEATAFSIRQEPIGSRRPVKLVLLAKLVSHHRGQLLSEAISQLKPDHQNAIEVHLVGTGFNELKMQLEPLCCTFDHGFVDRENIASLLKQMDYGLIPDCPEYGSQMKLLDYAAAGCLVLAPDVEHFVNFFEDSGVVFFSQSDSKSLTKRLEDLMGGHINPEPLAKKLQKEVLTNYTWDEIFEQKWKIIDAKTKG